MEAGILYLRLEYCIICARGIQKQKQNKKGKNLV